MSGIRKIDNVSASINGVSVPVVRPRSPAKQPDAAKPFDPPKTITAGSSHTRRRAGGRTLVDLQASQRLANGALIAEGDLAAIEARLVELRHKPYVEVTELGRVAGHPISAVHFGAGDLSKPPRLRVLITAGVHGDEVVGPAAALILMDRLLAGMPGWEGVEVTVVPCINPTGYLAGTRENADGLDLNRKWNAGDDAPLEVRILRRLLARRPARQPSRQPSRRPARQPARQPARRRARRPALIAIDLHAAGGDCDGFFALHLDSRALITDAMERLSPRYPVEGPDEGPYHYEAPGVFFSDNTGTLKDATKASGAQWSMTAEAPRAMPYREQVAGTVALVDELVDAANRAKPA